MKSNKTLATILLVVGILASAFANASQKIVDYYRYNQVLQYVNTGLKSEYLILESVLVNHRNKALEVWLLEDGKKKSIIHVLEGNRVTLPLLSDEQAKKHQFVFSASDKDIYILLYLRFKPLPKSIGYDELFFALDDYNAVKAILAPKVSWLNPDFDTLWLRFDSPASLFIKGDRYEQQIDANEGDIMLKIDERILGTNAQIRFDHAPTSVIALN